VRAGSLGRKRGREDVCWSVDLVEVGVVVVVVVVVGDGGEDGCCVVVAGGGGTGGVEEDILSHRLVVLDGSEEGRARDPQSGRLATEFTVVRLW
jgi:hypothetical protein